MLQDHLSKTVVKPFAYDLEVFRELLGGFRCLALDVVFAP